MGTALDGEAGLSGGRADAPRDGPADAPRVCLVTETFHPEIGGGETQGRLLAEGLRARGGEVRVVTRRSRSGLARREEVDGVAVRRVGPEGPGRLRKYGLVLTAFPPLLALARRADVLLVSGFRILGVPAVAAARVAGAAVVLKADSTGEMSGAFFAAGLERSGVRPDSLPVRAALRLRDAVLRRADAFVAISGTLERELLEAGVDPGRIARIPNCVDTARFRPPAPGEREAERARLGIPAGARVFAWSGRLVSYKGLPALLRAWQEVCASRPGTRLLLIGGGSGDMHNCEPELRSFVAAAGLEDRVTFTGPVDDVPRRLWAADAFVFPSEDEAFGLALVEAMACGLPAVSTAAGGLADIATDGENALVVAPRDTAGLRRALERLLDDPALRARLGTAALRTARERFARDAVIGSWLDLFRRLPRRRGRRTA